MRSLVPALLGLALSLTGCGQKTEDAAPVEQMVTMDATERLQTPAMPKEMAPSAAGDAAAAAAMDAAAAASDAAAAGGSAMPEPAAIPVSVPKIAYVYDFGFRLEADRIAALQRRHADLCERQGPQICRILDMRQSGAEGEFGSGSLSLAVAAPRARSFGAELGKAVADAGGSEVSSGISGEDLSKQIVDTEARLRARTLLRDRLMEVLATRKGTVAELVEAERGVAQVNEEIDQARSWLAEMKGRVDFSRVNIQYQSGARTSGGFMAPIRGAFGSMGSILGAIIATIIVVLTAAIPLGLLSWLIWLGVRRIRRAAAGRRQAEEARMIAEMEEA